LLLLVPHPRRNLCPESFRILAAAFRVDDAERLFVADEGRQRPSIRGPADMFYAPAMRLRSGIDFGFALAIGGQKFTGDNDASLDAVSLELYQ
jgi:hypothetical protein